MPKEEGMSNLIRAKRDDDPPLMSLNMVKSSSRIEIFIESSGNLKQTNWIHSNFIVDSNDDEKANIFGSLSDHDGEIIASEMRNLLTFVDNRKVTHLHAVIDALYR
ncbi:CLUMA_CG011606, isoform A [Clunio marinus]|uniref:CLUMA_CG011606, isoform A n=1 Tax=Clunio marinus TaxID=568069 RepID=A0A1J1IFB6_9DIPT|nr:CLUMA_CG011606, isoform A [Clunio marinus]